MKAADYYLMNKDKPLMKFTVSENGLGENVKCCEAYSDILPIGFVDIATWVENRNYAKHKQYFKKWLKEWGIDTTKGFLDITHGLGINDCLWVKPNDSCLKWEDVNLYTNEFSDVAQTTAFDNGLYGLQISSTVLVSPEFTSEGSCPKCWKREGKEIYLYKAGLSGASNVGLEPYSEYISSAISKQIIPKERTIEYDLCTFKERLCSKSLLFTDEIDGFVPFYKILDANKKYNIGDVLSICVDMGFEQQCREMFLVDSIVFNQDRHLGNFGFIFDNDTFEIKDFVPLFDFNISMLCNALDEDLDNFEKYEEEYQLGHKLGGRFLDVGKEIITPELKSEFPKTIEFPVHSKYNLEPSRINKLTEILYKNIWKITDKKVFAF